MYLDEIFCESCNTQFSGKYSSKGELMIYNPLTGKYKIAGCLQCGDESFVNRGGLIVYSTVEDEDELEEMEEICRGDYDV